MAGPPNSGILSEKSEICGKRVQRPIGGNREQLPAPRGAAPLLRGPRQRAVRQGRVQEGARPHQRHQEGHQGGAERAPAPDEVRRLPLQVQAAEDLVLRPDDVSGHQAEAHPRVPGGGAAAHRQAPGDKPGEEDAHPVRAAERRKEFADEDPVEHEGRGAELRLHHQKFVRRAFRGKLHSLPIAGHPRIVGPLH